MKQGEGKAGGCSDQQDSNEVRLVRQFAKFCRRRAAAPPCSLVPNFVHGCDWAERASGAGGRRAWRRHQMGRYPRRLRAQLATWRQLVGDDRPSG